MSTAIVKMTDTARHVPVSKRFFPGLLLIVSDDTYECVITRYRELYSNHELQPILNCDGTWSKGFFRGLPSTRSSGRAGNHKTTHWGRSIERSISSSPAMSSR